jgi:hypothetical protein
MCIKLKYYLYIILMQVLNAFNNYLKEFCQKLLLIVPTNENIKLINNTFHIGLITDKKIYIRHFNEQIKPFHNDILCRNEKIFLNHDFSLIPSVAEYENQIDEMKEIWGSHLSKEHKNIIWDYLKVLSTLSLKYHA